MAGDASPVSWREFAAAAPELAEAGRGLLYQFGPGLGFLATVRRDGAPRLHPICPLVVDGCLYAYIGSSPKLHDLLRDGRYALHSFPPANVDDEFFVSGRAVRVDTPARRDAASAAVTAQGTFHGAEDVLFELLIDRALRSAYGGRGPEFWPPTYTTWRT